MAAIDRLMEWMSPAIGSRWQMADGGFPDGPKFNDHFMCVVRGTGGPAPDVDDRRPTFRVILLGPTKSRKDKTLVRDACEAIMQLTLGESTPCGIAGVKALGEPVGPAYTAEDRAWMSLELQMTY